MAVKEKLTRIRKDTGKNIHIYIMLALALLFYGFFAFYDGAVICVDSPSYINKDISREPVYPIFLMLMETLSGWITVDYLFLAAFFQSLLAAFSAWLLAKFFVQELEVPIVISYGVLVLPFMVSLFCRFVAKRGSMYSNSILTEGIAIPLYLIFIRYLCEYVLKETKRSFLWCLLCSFVLFSIRKQMMIALVLLLLGILWMNLKKKKYSKALVGVLLSAVIVLGVSNLLDFGYNYAVRGEVTKHSSDTRFFTTIGFYVAEREDVQYIEGEELQELFLEIYDDCDTQGFLGNSAGEGWLNRVSHFGDNYDHIQIDTMWPKIIGYAREKVGEGTVGMNNCADSVMDQYNKSLLLHHIPEVLQAFLDNFASGLVTTIAQRRPILVAYSIVMYLLYLGLMVWHIRHRKSEKNEKIVVLSVVTMLSILANVGLVSLVIFTQTRYTIYNMALFYITMLVMGWNFIYSLASEKGNFIRREEKFL